MTPCDRGTHHPVLLILLVERKNKRVICLSIAFGFRLPGFLYPRGACPIENSIGLTISGRDSLHLFVRCIPSFKANRIPFFFVQVTRSDGKIWKEFSFQSDEELIGIGIFYIWVHDVSYLSGSIIKELPLSIYPFIPIPICYPGSWHSKVSDMQGIKIAAIMGFEQSFSIRS